MKLKRMNWLRAFLMAGMASALVSCNDEENAVGKGAVEFEITDAASDDANVKSVMVTVADVKVNGTSIEGFTRQTIDLKAYSEGRTKLLGNLQLDAKAYNNLVLVLDLDQDVNGVAPGSYVLTNDNVKYKLKSTGTGKTEIILNKSWTVASNTTTKVIMDFDLRKAIKYSNEESVKYSFVSDDNLRAAVRVVTNTKSGHVKGSYENESNVDAEKIVVYAYKKGTFNADVETQPQGTDEITFKNAAGSAEIKQSITGASYTLAFLEEGEYELHFVAYNQDAGTGRFSYSGQLQSETSVDGLVGDAIVVKGGVTLNIASSVKGAL